VSFGDAAKTTTGERKTAPEPSNPSNSGMNVGEPSSYEPKAEPTSHKKRFMFAAEYEIGSKTKPTDNAPPGTVAVMVWFHADDPVLVRAMMTVKFVL
jgi:hypothetical protein